MKYQSKSFTVPVTDGKPRQFCDHTWIRENGRCMWCDVEVPLPEPFKSWYLHAYAPIRETE